MDLLESYGKNFGDGTCHLLFVPIDLRVEGVEVGISKNEAVLPQTSDEELHSVLPASPLDFEPTVLGDLSLFFLCPVHVIDCNGSGERESSDPKCLPGVFVDEVLACSTVEESLLFSYLLHGGEFKVCVHCFDSLGARGIIFSNSEIDWAS